MAFQRNVGGADRVIRIVLGLVIMSVGAYYGSPWGLLGIVVLATGIFRCCPLYSILGSSTCKTQPVSDEGSGDKQARQQ